MAIVITLVLGLFMAVGAMIAHFTEHTHKIEQISVSIAFGTMAALAVRELIPESYAYLFSTLGKPLPVILLILAAAAVGIGILKILDHFIPEHDHAHGLEHHCSERNTMHIGIMSTVAIVLHNIIEGMAVYSVSASSLEDGLMIAIGVGLHNIPMGMMIYATLEHETRAKRWIMLACLALSTFVGGVLMHFLWGMISGFVIGLLIAVTLGMIVYIAVFELLPHILHAPRKWLSALCALGGVLIIVVCSFFE